VLGLELGAAGTGVAVDSDLLVAHEMLGGVEAVQRPRDAGDDGLDTLAGDAAQHRRRVRGEHGP